MSIYNVNMKIYCIFFCLLINIFGFINCKDDYVPVLFWSSPEIPEGPVLELNRINCKLFTNYLVKKLSSTKAFIMVFMEEVLSVDDFHWRTGKTHLRHPLFNTLNHRLKFFPCVEHPHEAIKQLHDHGYNIDYKQSDWKSKLNESSILIMEFRSLNNNERKNTLDKHYELMSGITKELKQVRKNWICIYTGKNGKRRELKLSRSLSSWNVDTEQSGIPQKPLYLYKDEALGLALLTRGPIQLHLPMHNNFTIVYLENHAKGVSFTIFEDTLDLVLWFTKYTLSFSMTLVNNDWFIDSINVQKDDGHSMKLSPRIGILKEKKHSRFSVFQSKGKPTVRVLISKYKVVHINENGSSCVNKYNASFLCMIMFAATASVTFIAWSILLYAYKIPISTRSKTIQISFDEISSRKSMADMHFNSLNAKKINGNCIR